MSTITVRSLAEAERLCRDAPGPSILLKAGPKSGVYLAVKKYLEDGRDQRRQGLQNAAVGFGRLAAGLGGLWQFWKGLATAASQSDALDDLVRAKPALAPLLRIRERNYTFALVPGGILFSRDSRVWDNDYVGTDGV